MSDDVAKRLVEAAGGRGAAVAVLRVLADYVRDEEPDGKQVPGYDEGWADAYDQVANDIEAIVDFIGRPEGES